MRSSESVTGQRPAMPTHAVAPAIGARESLRRVLVVIAAVGVGLVIAVNLYLAGRSIGNILGGAPAVDWQQYVEASRRLSSGGDLYAVTHDYAYRYSPVLAAVFALVAPIGAIGWRALHVLAALALPSMPMRLVALASWPFWYDVETGNLMIFVVLAAAWALRGSRLATGAFLLGTILVPRPLMLPVAAWLLWRRPEWRWPFAGAFAIHTIGVIVLGWAGGWLATIVAAGADASLPSNIGPGRFVGTVPWLTIGIALAAWLTWKGRLGWASLAASPYWLPYYLLVAVLEADRIRWPSRTRRP